MRTRATMASVISLDGCIGPHCDRALARRLWLRADPKGVCERAFHQLRAQSDVVLVGLKTAIKDNPRLTVRLAPGRNPVRAVVDSQARLPSESRLLDTTQAHTLIFVTERASARRTHALTRKGAEVVCCGPGPRVDLSMLLASMSERGLTRLMVEGGATLHRSFIDQGLYDEVKLFVVPTFLGDGTPLVAGGRPPANGLNDEFRLKSSEVLGNCTLQTYDVRRK